MVVLAFKTQGILDGRVTVVTSVHVGDELLGEFGLAQQEFMPGSDGFDYYLNLFLVVTGPEYVGQIARVDVEVEDAEGHSVERTVEVVLVGGQRGPGPTPDITTDADDPRDGAIAAQDLGPADEGGS